jgi:hypothetical protein
VETLLTLIFRVTADLAHATACEREYADERAVADFDVTAGETADPKTRISA